MLVKKQELTRETWAKLFASQAVLNSALAPEDNLPPGGGRLTNAPHRKETT